jgi:hypothetical protein
MSLFIIAMKMITGKHYLLLFNWFIITFSKIISNIILDCFICSLHTFNMMLVFLNQIYLQIIHLCKLISVLLLVQKAFKFSSRYTYSGC